MIETIELKNFKCFRDSQSIALNKVNLFTGYNGAGKSTVLQSILLLAQSVVDNELRTLKANGKYVELGTVSDLVNHNSADSRISISLNSINPTYSLNFDFKPDQDNARLGIMTGFVMNDNNQFGVSQSIGSAGTGNNHSETDAEKNELKQKKVLQCADWSFLKIFKGIHYFSANRLGPTLYEPRTELDTDNPIGGKGEHRLEALRGRKDIVRDIEEEMEYILDSRCKIDLEEGEESSSVLNLKFGVDEVHKVKSVNNGFGFTYILPLLMALNMQKDGKIFIENPEAHLHPRAQSRLIQVLVKKAMINNNQLFVESHSEHILNGIRLACILDDDENPLKKEDVKIYFFTSENEVEPLTLDENMQVHPWYEGFFDQQQKDSSEILRRGLLK